MFVPFPKKVNPLIIRFNIIKVKTRAVFDSLTFLLNFKKNFSVVFSQ